VPKESRKGRFKKNNGNVNELSRHANIEILWKVRRGRILLKYFIDKMVTFIASFGSLSPNINTGPLKIIEVNMSMSKYS